MGSDQDYVPLRCQLRARTQPCADMQLLPPPCKAASRLGITLSSLGNGQSDKQTALDLRCMFPWGFTLGSKLYSLWDCLLD